MEKPLVPMFVVLIKESLCPHEGDISFLRDMQYCSIFDYLVLVQTQTPLRPHRY